mgnify:CR=1 FL=1
MGNSLKGKVVLITGASSGFGEHAAKLFAQEGCRVVLAARRLNLLQQLADEIQDAGGEALAIPVDVAECSEIDVMVKSTLDIYGQIDILFNNAGFGQLDWLENLDMKRDIETQIAVNLTGLIQVTRAVLPHMIEQGSGHIINMSSIAGFTAAPLYSVYAATKFGVRGFTNALRCEVRHFDIRVSGIYPGAAATEFSKHIAKDSIKNSFKSPVWMLMTSEFVAQQVVKTAKRPRRALILPWWMSVVVFLNNNFPWISDFFQIQFAKKYHTK